MFVYDVSRFHIRSSSNLEPQYALSSFWLTKSGMFLIPFVDVNEKDTTYRLFAGTPIDKDKIFNLIYGHLSQGDMHKLGAQVNLHKLSSIEDIGKPIKLNAFIQYFPSQYQEEILFSRIQFNISKNFVVRNTASIDLVNNHKEIVLDLIRPINRAIDLYSRANYSTLDNPILDSGYTFELGIRFSKKFL